MGDPAYRSRVGSPGPVRLRLPGKAAIATFSCCALALFGALAFEASSTRSARNPLRMAPIPKLERPSPIDGATVVSDEVPPIPRDSAANAARLANSRTLFRSGTLATTPPFFIGGDVSDRLRAIDCLAAAAYYEAGTSAVDQRAVVQVVLNRLRHPAFPHTVCGVVFQGSDRVTGCQFTFTCDGAMTRRQPTPLAWRQAQQVA